MSNGILLMIKETDTFIQEVSVSFIYFEELFA